MNLNQASNKSSIEQIKHRTNQASNNQASNKSRTDEGAGMAGVEGRVALVTGGGQGIGAAIAARLAAGGAKVGVLDLDEANTAAVVAGIVDTGGSAIGVRADVSKADQVQAAVDRVVSELGGLQILVNNAGVLRDNLLFKMSEEDWDLVMNVHLKGAFLCSKTAQKHMVDAKYGRIITMSSTSALGNRGQANYATAKAGLQGLTKTLAIELGPFGVTANAIAPGFIETAMTKATAERVGTTIEQMREAVAAAVPVRRGGLPDDVANTVAFLAGEESGYVTGQVIYVDGGRGLI
jgi:3-oxoacyl-[acyl-carrier protein] reductase